MVFHVYKPSILGVPLSLETPISFHLERKWSEPNPHEEMFQPLIFRGVCHVDADSSVVCFGKRMTPHQPHWSGNTMVTYGGFADGFAEWCWRFFCPTDLDEEGWCDRHQLQDISCRIYGISFSICIYICIDDFCLLLNGWKILDRQALKLES